MWETIENSLREAQRQMKAVEGTAWGAALGGLVAAITEGTRFARNKVDKLNKDITNLQNRLSAVEGKVDQVFVPPVSPGIPQPINLLGSFTTNGGTVTLVSGDDRGFRMHFNNNGNTVVAGSKLGTIKFGKPFVAPPKVFMQKVGATSGTVELYPDSASQTSFDMYVDSWVAGEPEADYDFLIIGPQQVAG